MRTLSLLLPALVLIGLAGCSGSAPRTTTPAPDDAVVAEYAGERLTLDAFEDRYARTVGSREAAAADSLAAYEDFLERYVNFRLKVIEARSLGLAEDPALQQEVADYRQQLARPYFMEREVLNDIVRDLYEKQREEIRAAHILILASEDAAPADTFAAYHRLAAVRDSVLAGADFHEMAARHSEDPSAARNRGDLGYFSGGRMIEAFEKMVFATPVGEVSPVFRTRFGYHILQVQDRRPAAPQIRAAHILVRLSPESTPADSAEARALLTQLRERALAGEDFATLAQQYSDDAGSAQRGGDLGFFDRSRMVEPFAEAAYALENPGDLSEIVETQFGLHLIRLTERKAPETYEEAFDRLKQLAQRLPRTAERRQEVGQRFREEVGSELRAGALAAAVAAHPADDALRLLVTEGFGDWTDSTLATVGDSTITFGEFGLHLRRTRLNPERDALAQLTEAAETFVNERAVDFAAYRLEARDPSFRQIMADYEDGVLLFRISEDSVWTAAAQDSLGLRRYFDEHADRYQYPERRRIIGFYSRSDSLLQVVAEALDAGQTPAQIETLVADAEHSVRVDTVRLATAGDDFFERAFALTPGQRTAIQPYRSERAILYLDGIEPPRGMTFEEARAQVISDYQDRLERAFVERLRRKYDARLYPERLGAAFADVEVPAEATGAEDPALGAAQ